MKAKEKKMILILVLITIALILLKIIITNSNKESKEKVDKQQQTSIIEQTENGVKQSNSEKLKETKKLRDLDVTDIQITEENGELTIRANVINNTTNLKNEFPVNVKLLNSKGEVIQELGAYVGKMKAGETRTINASINMDISEIYDIQFE